MLLKLIIFLILFTNFLSIKTVDIILDYDFALNTLINYQGTNIYLLSYPRSGNSWTRYALEFLTKRPTYHPWDPSFLPNLPLGLMTNISINFNKPPIWKAHTLAEMDFNRLHDPYSDLLILVLRNPKEAITRHEGKPPNFEMLSNKYKVADYFNNLFVYDKWCPSNRLLILYENLMINPRKTFCMILDFLKDSHEYVDDFFDHFEEHKNIMLNLYGQYSATQSKGNDILFHSKKISGNNRMQIDKWIEELYPELWCNYLKDSYSEESLIARGAYD